MTLRGRLLLSNLAMVLGPLALVLALGAVFLSFVQEGSALPPGFRPWPWAPTAAKRPLPTRQMLALTQTTLRKINVETLDHPDRWTDPAFWADLDDQLLGNDAGLAVVEGGSLLYASADLGPASGLAGLPPWGSLTGSLAEGNGLASKFRLLGQWDYPAQAHGPVSVYLLWIIQPWNSALEGFTAFVLAVFFGSTLLLGLGLTVLVGRSLLKPLNRLQSAAARIASGDLSGPLGEVRKDELAPLFADFEAMRAKLLETQHLRERYEADRRDLIAHIAHDLKTPVTAINGYVQGILEGVASTPEKQRQYLEVIAAKARDLDRRTDELFFFSSLELGTLPYAFQRFDFGAFLQGLWNDLLLEYGPQGLGGPAPALPPGPLPVRGDPARLRRLVANLADNTVKFRRGPGATWTWTLDASGPAYRLALADDGVGIGAEALPRVFEQFYRADDSRTSQVPGTGLGLAIVARIAADHGGRVEASSVPGQGTTIVVELPKP